MQAESQRNVFLLIFKMTSCASIRLPFRSPLVKTRAKKWRKADVGTRTPRSMIIRPHSLPITAHPQVSRPWRENSVNCSVQKKSKICENICGPRPPRIHATVIVPTSYKDGGKQRRSCSRVGLRSRVTPRAPSGTPAA